MGISQGSSRPYFALMIHEKAYRTQKSCYINELWFITVKGYRLKSVKGKGTGTEVQEKPGASSLSVESYGGKLNSPSNDV